MSNIVQGLCYRAKFGCPKRKAIAVAMGDHAHDDGSNIWPSVRRLSSKVEWSERTVQRVLRELESVGLLIVVNEGGGGPKDTREWKFNMDLLRDLSDGKAELSETKGDSETSLEGDCESPLQVLRVSTGQVWVPETASKGDTAGTRTINNHHEPSGAGARGSEKSAPASPAKAQLVLPDDAEWFRWITWADDKGTRKHFESEGAMCVFAPYPGPGVPVPKLAPKMGSARWTELFEERAGRLLADAARKSLSPQSKRMTGESE